jgi:hypothetical protein
MSVNIEAIHLMFFPFTIPVLKRKNGPILAYGHGTYSVTTVNCHNMKMIEQNHNFTPKRMIFPKTMCTKKCVSAG